MSRYKPRLCNRARLRPFQHLLVILLQQLNRHIELDAGHHGPTVEQMMESLCGDSLTHWHLVEVAASDALQARLCLWDGEHQQIQDARFRQRSLNLET